MSRGALLFGFAVGLAIDGLAVFCMIVAPALYAWAS